MCFRPAVAESLSKVCPECGFENTVIATQCIQCNAELPDSVPGMAGAPGMPGAPSIPGAPKPPSMPGAPKPPSAPRSPGGPTS